MTGIGNEFILTRLEGIHQKLKILYKGLEQSSSASKGNDRELFINEFLSIILPPQYRFGHGEVTDLEGNLSGQLDIVIEYPLFPSLPLVQGGSRLYTAEGVAAVIEVKSNLESQWEEVKRTSSKLKKIKRSFGINEIVTPRWIPLFAVGYTGWKREDTIGKKLKSNIVDGILIIDSGIFMWNPPIYIGNSSLTKSAKGAWSLWAFIVCIHHLTVCLQQTDFAPALYAMPDLLLFHKIYCASKTRYKNGEVVVFDITDKEGINRENVKQLVKDFESSKLMKIISEHASCLIVNITPGGKQLGRRLLEMLK